jgi:hypothetical protein
MMLISSHLITFPWNNLRAVPADASGFYLSGLEMILSEKGYSANVAER